MDIRIIVNKKEQVIPNGITYDQLLQLLGYTSRVAIWVNGRQLLMADYETRQVREEDEVKIKRIIAGG
ncbi:MAG: sulfur carrier protein ThiS [Eubacteriales bacterium]|nr:sulfur carrier protein ThiS [Eubacteriales bacterium]MDD4583971.1 sulfur carrier protein ThiS [Eubacteriales bacterium]